MMFRVVFITFLLLLMKEVVQAQLFDYLNVPNVEDVRVYEDVYETYRLPNNTR